MKFLRHHHAEVPITSFEWHIICIDSSSDILVWYEKKIPIPWSHFSQTKKFCKNVQFDNTTMHCLPQMLKATIFEKRIIARKGHCWSNFKYSFIFLEKRAKIIVSYFCRFFFCEKLFHEFFVDAQFFLFQSRLGIL